MKKYIYLLLLVTVNLSYSFSQSINQNFISKREYRSSDKTQFLDNIQYYDGLGRPTVSVQKNITSVSSGKKDLVSLQEYDDLGRESKSWLPAAIVNNNGNYVSPSSIMSYSKSTNKNEENDDQKPYSYSVYEKSPLNRILTQFGVGEDWHNTENGKAIRTDYFTNRDGGDTLNCINYTIIDSGDTIMSIRKIGNYESNQLYVTRILDENGKTSFEFKNKLGQILLQRHILGVGNIKNVDTYYIYDDFGNLRAVLPPIASDEMKSGTTWSSNATGTIRNYVYLYKYDGRRRNIAKKIPGCGWIINKYDKGDRLVFSQDGEQRRKKEWMYHIYDLHDRNVITGVCKETESLRRYEYDFDGEIPSMTFNELLSVIDESLLYSTFDPSYFSDGYVKSSDGNVVWLDLPNMEDYIKISIDFKDNTKLIINYFDEYDFLRDCLFYDIVSDNLDYDNTQSGFNTRSLKNNGLQTGKITAVLDGSGKMLCETMYYDSFGRLIQGRASNHLGGVESEYIAYNFSGQPIKKKHIHTAQSKNAQTEEYSYTYDHAGRLTKTTHKLNNGSEIVLAENTYDDLGRIKIVKKANNENLKSTYSYNVRSWTKAITGNYFTQKLYYNESYGGSGKQYNGNISAMDWQIQGENFKRGYAFSYDDLSRLASANYLINGSGNTNYNIKNITYDKHGNIKTLQRYGKTSSGATYALVDNLTMNHIGNQLSKVTDGVTANIFADSHDFKDSNSANVPIEYSYNLNGALYKDYNKGITDIQYNSLNLPQVMVINSSTAKAKNYYTYSASGVKLKTQQRYDPNLVAAPVTSTSPTNDGLSDYKNTDYVANIIYESNKIDASIINKTRILVEGGYIEDEIYHFYLTDHLGNNRVVAKADGTVIQKNHYYPFGMLFAETIEAEQGKQPYKYNGKELDRMHGLNLYDYSARHYDAGVPHFTTVDPLAEKFYNVSPYVYCANNPIKFIDPTGMWYDDYFNYKGSYLGTDNSNTDNIRIIDEGEWNRNKVEDGTMDPSLGTQISVLHSKAALSNEASFNIFSHYNPTKLSTTMRTTGGANMAYSRTSKKSTGELTSETLKINPIILKKDGYADKINDIKNIFAHEKGHYDHFHKVGKDIYNKLSNSQKEFQAFSAQMNDPTWSQTSQNLKDHVDLYMRSVGISIIKVEPISISPVKEIKSLVPLIIK